MLTILEAINLSAGYLDKKGIENARLNAELLLCSILDCKKINLYLNFDKPLEEVETQKYRELLKRRAGHEPLQYITGTTEFYGLTFKTTKAALIPRPETEFLVEKVIEEWKGKEVKILDIGTGTGNIPVAISCNLPGSIITAIDKSEEALKLASENALLNNCQDIEFRRIDILTDEYKLLDKFDVIVSNPPYISRDDFNELEPELRVYEPAGALTDMGNGLLFYTRITEIALQMINPGGKIYLEMGKGQSEQVKKLFSKQGFSSIKITKDYQNIDRIISGELI